MEVAVSVTGTITAISGGRRTPAAPPGPGSVVTSTGKTINLADPRPESVDFEDIAHTLSQICRFGGRTRRFYSVAEHNVLVSRIAPPRLALEGLLHGAHKAYLGDVVPQLKAMLPEYRRLAHFWDLAISRRFEIVLSPMAVEIHEADLVARHIESRDLLSSSDAAAIQAEVPVHLRAMSGSLAGRQEVRCLPPESAKRLFISRCLELVR